MRLPQNIHNIQDIHQQLEPQLLKTSTRLSSLLDLNYPEFT
jgi:hypothetical protein